jgi:ferrous iron transport protein B
LGWDWRIGVGAIASFPAREVIIATLGTIYSLGSDVDESNQSLMDSMRNATRPDGKKVYNVPVALSIMVFFALCAQCAGTLMTIKRETNSWIWPAFTFVYMTLLAYLGALLTYQIGMLL